jgi:hypothetical protein
MHQIKRKKQRRKAPPGTELHVYTRERFCDVHGISLGLFHILMRQGRGPRVMKLGRRTLISVEAAAEWRRRMEKEPARPPATTGAGVHEQVR